MSLASLVFLLLLVHSLQMNGAQRPGISEERRTQLIQQAVHQSGFTWERAEHDQTCHQKVLGHLEWPVTHTCNATMQHHREHRKDWAQLSQDERDEMKFCVLARYWDDNMPVESECGHNDAVEVSIPFQCNAMMKSHGNVTWRELTPIEKASLSRCIVGAMRYAFFCRGCGSRLMTREQYMTLAVSCSLTCTHDILAEIYALHPRPQPHFKMNARCAFIAQHISEGLISGLSDPFRWHHYVTSKKSDQEWL